MPVGTASLEFEPQISAAGRFVVNCFLPAAGSGFLTMVYTYVAVSLLSWKQSNRQTASLIRSRATAEIEISIRTPLSKLIQRHLTNYSLSLFFLALCQRWMDKLSEFYGPHPIPSVAPANITSLY